MFGISDKLRIMTAAYSFDRLKNVKMYDIPSFGDGEAEFRNHYTIPQDADKIKVYIWRTSDMKPMSEVNERDILK